MVNKYQTVQHKYLVCEFCGRADVTSRVIESDGKPVVICASCMLRRSKKALANDDKIKTLKKKELYSIIIGMIIGAVLGIIATVAYVKTEGYMLVYAILIPIWITFGCGSFISSAKRIKNEHKSGDLIGTIINIIASIILSPIATPKRIIKLKKEIKEIEDTQLELQRNMRKLIKIKERLGK